MLAAISTSGLSDVARRSLLASLAGAGLLLGGRVAIAATDADPRQFLTALYDTYRPGRPEPDTLGKAADKIFDAHLLGLIRRDQRQADGEEGALDSDPICACQDFENLSVKSIAIQPNPPNAARAEVKFTNIGDLQTVRFVLTRTSDGWRISDVSEAGMPSLRAYLENALKAPAPKATVAPRQ